MYQVQNIMTPCPIAVSPEATIDEAITLLLNHRVSGLPVVDPGGQLLGVISELDIIDLVYLADIENSVVREHMTSDVRCLDAEASLDDAASVFCTKTIRRIPIVREGRLVGILSRRDLIRFLRDVRNQTVAH